ncbi:MAG: hypothetical protein U1F64_16845 [Burkholderiales bacterium]
MTPRTHRRLRSTQAASFARVSARALAPVPCLAVRRHDRGTLACLGSAR